MLRDARTQLTIRGETVDLAGLRYWTNRVQDITRVMRGASPNLILIAHTPKRLIEAAALSVPLMLSGHTHGGQIVLPGLGAIAAREFPVVWGSARRDNTSVFVTRGVGNGLRPGPHQLPSRSRTPHNSAVCGGLSTQLTGSVPQRYNF